MSRYTRCHQPRNRTISLRLLLVMVAAAGFAGPAAAQQKLRVVATLPTYAAIAREITGPLADVQAIARGDEDPHFVTPRPSFAVMMQRADLFIVTGLDLELWVPALLDRANNPKILEGGPGHVTAYAGITLRDIPQSVSRTGGDVHVFGNPHIHTDPINAISIARNIVAGLRRIDPGNGVTYDANLRRFEDRILRRLFGDQLVEMLGGETLFSLAREDRFWEFAQSQSFRDRPLTTYVGGWLGEGVPFRNRRMVCYHKNWAYFSHRFQIECAMYVEPKPGIPPAPGHVAEVIDFIQREQIPVLFAANYFSRTQVERVASRTGATAVIVPEHVGGESGVDEYFQLIDRWVSALAAGFRGTTVGHP